MTLYVYLERVVVDGPLPVSPHLWREAFAEALATELGTGPTGLPATSDGVRVAALRPASLAPTGRAAPVAGVAAGEVGTTVGGAIRAGIGGWR